ncbi:two component transcriptional regulator, winged helix family [Dehalogenimonas lykanthroporepellens BL-DC-9]|jgi:two-component system KDP operon response regulator KdpE|nr:two component transcriptional regulator, winged helix family [Dehalogenimonas lykanthroporepellens BL-DC-9]
MKVLIIEDDRTIVDYLELAFNMNMPDAELFTARFGKEGVSLAQAENPEVVILDLGLPDMDGFEVLKSIRQSSQVLIMVLTARGDEQDIVKGLEWGADDYVVKPFRQMELLARVRTLLRRQAAASEPPVISFSGFTLDTARNVLQCADNGELELTRTEGLIMSQLMRNKGNVVSHDRLAEIIWGENYPGAVNALRVYIGRLRRKLEESKTPCPAIMSKPGLGYYLEMP